MPRFGIVAAMTLGLALLASNASAKQVCKDAAGHFTKCPPAAAVAAKPAATLAKTPPKPPKPPKPALVTTSKPVSKPATLVTTSKPVSKPTTLVAAPPKPTPKPPLLATAPPKTGACKDANGRFIKCPVAVAAVAAAKPATFTTPAVGPAGPAGATARCKDGTFSHSKTHSGSCSRHGGVAAWL